MRHTGPEVPETSNNQKKEEVTLSSDLFFCSETEPAYEMARSASMAWRASIIFCADSSMSMTRLSILDTK